MLLTSEVHNAVMKYCPSLVNWIVVERDMNQKINHQTYGLKPIFIEFIFLFIFLLQNRTASIRQ